MKIKIKKYKKPELKVHGDLIKITNNVGSPPGGDGLSYAS